MMRRAIYQQLHGYNPAYDYGFDYNFLLRASAVTKLANLPEPLLAVRIHPASSSHRHRHRQHQYGLLAQQKAISTLLGKSGRGARMTLEITYLVSNYNKAPYR